MMASLGPVVRFSRTLARSSQRLLIAIDLLDALQRYRVVGTQAKDVLIDLFHPIDLAEALPQPRHVVVKRDGRLDGRELVDAAQIDGHDAVPPIILAADPFDLRADLRVGGVEPKGALQSIEGQVRVLVAALPDLHDLQEVCAAGLAVGGGKRVVCGRQLFPGGLEGQVVFGTAGDRRWRGRTGAQPGQTRVGGLAGLVLLDQLLLGDHLDPVFRFQAFTLCASVSRGSSRHAPRRHRSR